MTDKPDHKTMPDRSNLAGLYPEPKTYDQKLQDDKQLQQAYRRHWPKRPYLNTAIYGCLIFGLSVWFAQNLNAWWFGSDDKGITMATVFFTFAIGLGIAFLTISWVRYVNRLFSYFGGPTLIYWIIQAVLVAILITVWRSGWGWEYTNILWVPSLVTLEFAVLIFSTLRIMGRR